ncbi:MAG: efflux RND transporter permease subunit, partial [Candidatus Velthaea sp.]
MRLTQLFVNRPPLVFVVLALIAIVGVFSLATLVQQQFPNIDFPTVNVSVSYPGASPSELRDAVVRPLEDAIAGAPDLDHITTSIQQNQASISATFTLDSNQTTDLTSVQDRIQTAQSALPVDLPAPSVRTFDPAQAVVVTLSLTSSSLSVAGLSAIVTNNIVPALEQVDGISSVTANGTVTPALEVTVDPQKLASYGYTPNDVVSAIQANNVRAPGGIVYSGNRETTVDIRGDVTTPQSIADLLLTGSTAVLTGATSPSGTLTQKYNSVTGSTNQALALGSATASSTTSSATGSIGTIGSVQTTLTGLSSTSAAGSGSSSSSATAGTSATSAAGAGSGTAGANGSNAAANGTATSTTASATASTASGFTGATVSTPTPAANGTPAPGTIGSTIGNSTITSSIGTTGGAAVTPVPSVTSAASIPVQTISTPVPTTTATAGAGGISPSGAIATASTLTSAAASSAAAANQTSSIATVSSGSGSASSGAAGSATNPWSTAARLPRIGDVAQVTDFYEPKRVASYVNGKYAITLNVQKGTGASEVTSSEN